MDQRSVTFGAGDAQRIWRRCEQPDRSEPRRPNWFLPTHGWPTIGEFALLTNIPAWRWQSVIEGRSTIDLDMAIALSLYWKVPVRQFLELQDAA